MVEAQRALLDELMGTGMFPVHDQETVASTKQLMMLVKQSETESLFLYRSGLDFHEGLLQKSICVEENAINVTASLAI